MSIHRHVTADQRQRATARFLERSVYPLPDPLETQSQFDQYTHADLQDMAVPDLRDELRRVELRLLLEHDTTPWLREREAALRAALWVLRQGVAR